MYSKIKKTENNFMQNFMTHQYLNDAYNCEEQNAPINIF